MHPPTMIGNSTLDNVVAVMRQEPLLVILTVQSFE